MSKDYSKYIQFLAAEYNVLYVGKESIDVFDTIESYFKSSSKIEMSSALLEQFTSTLSKCHINLVIFDVEDNNEMVFDFYNIVQSFDENILVLLMFNPKEYRKVFDVVPLVDATLSYPFSDALFYKRLFMLLSSEYALRSIGRREVVLKNSKDINEDALDEFFDIYEGSSLFIADELAGMAAALNDGNLSKNFLINIANKLEEVADIFSKTAKTEQITPIYKELAEYLRSIDLSSLEASTLKGFDSLAEILNDISVYLMDMFVDRIFKDVNIYKDSLQSNIDYMKSIFDDGCEEESGELDFF